MRLTARDTLPTLACAAALLAAPGCGTTPPVPAPPVRPERHALQRLVEQPGWVEAYERAPLFARIAGYVRAVRADIGTRVRKDDVLAEVDVPEMEVDLKQKEAAVGQAEAQVKQARAAVLSAEAQRERLKSQYERLAKAGRGGVIDQENVEEARFAYQAAEAGLERAKADVAAAEAQVAVAKASRDHVRTMLQFAQIRAPFDGVVSERHVDTGHLLEPTAKGSPLFVVVRTDRVRIFLDVPETDAVLVQKDAVARIRIQGLDDEEVEGTVAGTSWALDPGQRTLRTEVDFPNPDGKLRPGMYAYATIKCRRPEALTVPTSAVLTRDHQTFCYCVEDGKAVRLPIKIGARDGTVVEVLKKQTGSRGAGQPARWEDFTGREEIIPGAAATLTDGQTVQVAPHPSAHNVGG